MAAEPWDRVDHVVNYLFDRRSAALSEQIAGSASIAGCSPAAGSSTAAGSTVCGSAEAGSTAADPTVAPASADPSAADRCAMDAFFELGGRLAEAGCIPERLPAVHLGGFALTEAASAPSVLVDPATLPWRPHRGVHLVIDEPGCAPADMGAVLGLDGVAGMRRWRAEPSLHDRFDDLGPISLTVVYPECDPLSVVAKLEEWACSASSGAHGTKSAAPLHSVAPFDWERHLP